MKASVRQPTSPPRIAVVPSVAMPPAAKTSRTRRLYVLAGLGVVVLAASGYALYVRPWDARPVAVSVEFAVAVPVTRAIAVNGRIAAQTTVQIHPVTAGRILSVSAAQGDVVEAGATLAQQDGTALSAVVRQAFAALDAGIVRQQQAQATVASGTALAGNIARATLQADTRLLVEADREVDRLQGLLDQAQFQLASLTIVSPMSGTILSRGVEIGLVADTQTVLFTIADLAHLVVDTDIDELYASQVKLGQDALLLPAGQTAPVPGSVSRLSPLIDEATGGMAVELSFANPQLLPLGMTVTANVVIDQSPQALTVPRGAIVKAVAASSLYLLQDGRAVLVPVLTIDWPAERLIVTSGLAAGDVVITDPAGLSDGDSVTARR